MGLLSVDLLITLQILPVFFSNCLFLALYDSVILLKHVALLLSRSKSTRGEWRRMLTSEGLRCVWNSFLLDAYKQVTSKFSSVLNSVKDTPTKKHSEFPKCNTV
uniref:Iodothyronine deiodinase n=1 Tax=Mus spicilegus TaxID=10103 RepID=A0A8C6IIK9_MUSSI